MVDQLAEEYADQDVVFVENNVDAPLGDRISRWWAGYGAGGTVTLPLAMVDSGHEVTNGSEDFHTVYSTMIDTALDRAPTALLDVDRERDGATLTFEIRLTNLSGVTLASNNSAALHTMVYEEPTKGVSSRVVRAASSRAITGLADGEVGLFTLQLNAFGVDWTRARSVVLVDYRPGGSSGAYDMLQAALQE